LLTIYLYEVIHTVWVEKLKEMNVSEQDFENFCSKYPEFKTNKELMAKLYLATVKGVRVAEPRVTGELVKVSSLTPNVPARIRVVVVQNVEKRAYVGCPKCFKKLQAAPNTTVECPRDGLVKAQVLEWNLALAGDDTGEIMLSIPPSVSAVPNPGDVIAVEGTLTEQEEFIVWRYSSAVAAAEMKPEVTVQAAPVPIQVTVTTPTVTPQVSVTAPAVPVTTTAQEFVCPECKKTFKSDQALKIHMKLAHKPKPAAPAPTAAPVKPVEAKPAEQPKPTQPAPQVTIPEEAIKLTRIAATIEKPFEEFKAFITTRYPNINIDELFKAAKVQVVDGKVKHIEGQAK